jgi:hypothetical protein
MEFDRTRDAVLGSAVIVSPVLGLLSLYASFVIGINPALRTGMIKLHFFEPPTSHPEGRLVFMGIALLSVSIPVTVAVTRFRLIMRVGEARTRNE